MKSIGFAIVTIVTALTGLAACSTTVATTTHGGQPCSSDADCKNGYSCVSDACESTSTSSGSLTTGADAGTADSGTKDSGAPPAYCPVTFTDATCDSCFQNKCATQCDACGADAECAAAITCVANCSTASCEADCLTGLSAATTAHLNAMLKDPTGCLYTECRDECTTPAKTGDDCVANADCASGECSQYYSGGGWCSIRGCTSNTECGIDTAGELVWCTYMADQTYQCMPGCQSDADCTTLCSATTFSTCKPASVVNGATSARVCSC